MPELPEVEIVKRGLEPVLSGRRIVSVEQRRKDLRFPFPLEFCARIEGRRVRALERRAKYILARLDSGDVLVMHLGMTGRFSVASKSIRSKPLVLGEYIYNSGNDTKHDHVVIRTSTAEITYNDPRRFGFMLLIPEADLNHHALFGGLGVEPLGNALNAGYLAERARGRRSDLKSFLLDQRIVAGLGNIYVSEALHRAGLSPKRLAGSLATKCGAAHVRAERLVPEIRNVLTAAIEAGGSTLRDYRHADGKAGSFQESFAVYDREGKPCTRPGCKGTVRRIIQAGRSTFYCAACQR